MRDYEPLDLSGIYNSGPQAYPRERRPALGDQLLRGLPFRIGSTAEKNCFLCFRLKDELPEGAEAADGLSSAESLPPANAVQPVTIPVEREAHNIIFAHVLLESHLHEGAHPGGIAARYRFQYVNGEMIEVPIRERYEISTAPVGWGELPFLAVPDRNSSLPNRKQGHWGNAGFRQTEASQGTPNDYVLWNWRNPHPELSIHAITILPGAGDGVLDLSFLIAGITLGFLDEDPFGRTAAVPVQITVTDSAAASKPFDLEVEIDRGVATFPYPLPQGDADSFLQDSMAGWGEEMNDTNSAAYVEIAATPSATMIVKSGESELARTPWAELEQNGVVEQPGARIEIVTTGRNWVHTTVLDDETGRPIPCRIHFRTPSGIPYAPHGHHPHVNSNMGTWHIDVGGDLRLGQISYAYIDGRCQGWLPRGEVIVDVARGFEYEPLRTRLEIEPGQRELTLRLKRHSNLNAERYFSGDTHVHFLSTQGALTEAAAEDLDVVNLLLSQWGHLFTNTEEFTGRPSVAGDGETIVYATQENRQHLLGHLTLLGLKDPVMPWCSDGPSEAEMGGNLETTLSHWADACHDQGGTVVIPHLPNPNGEPAALIATGRADAVEMLIQSPFFHLEYYRYLNGGYRLPLAGGTDKMDSGVPVGLYRTYAHIPPDEPFTYENWLRALRSGNTFLSGGPLLRMKVDGQPIGSMIRLGPGGGAVDVEVSASSIFPIDTLEIVQGGRVVAAEGEAAGTRALQLRTQLKIERSTWLCARCSALRCSATRHQDSWRRGIMAHTSPVYLSCGDIYDVCDPATLQYMLTLVDGSLDYIRNRAPQWKPETVSHHHGEPDHQAFLERPFHEANEAIHRKMHEHGIPH